MSAATRLLPPLYQLGLSDVRVMELVRCILRPPFFTCGIECLGEVSQEVIRVLAPRTETNKTFGNGIATPTGTPFGSGVDAAKTGGFVDQLAGGEKCLGLLPVRQHKADDRAKALHLTPGNSIGRVMG